MSDTHTHPSTNQDYLGAENEHREKFRLVCHCKVFCKGEQCFRSPLYFVFCFKAIQWCAKDCLKSCIWETLNLLNNAILKRTKIGGRGSVFLSFWVSEFLSYQVSEFLSFQFSNFPSFQVSHCANRQTDTHTDGHGDSMTELAQWSQFSEK